MTSQHSSVIKFPQPAGARIAHESISLIRVRPGVPQPAREQRFELICLSHLKNFRQETQDPLPLWVWRNQSEQGQNYIQLAMHDLKRFIKSLYK